MHIATLIPVRSGIAMITIGYKVMQKKDEGLQIATIAKR